MAVFLSRPYGVRPRSVEREPCPRHEDQLGLVLYFTGRLVALLGHHHTGQNVQNLTSHHARRRDLRPIYLETAQRRVYTKIA